MSPTCAIEVQNPQAVYYPRGIVEGRVICHFDAPSNIIGVKVRIIGREHNNWKRDNIKNGLATGEYIFYKVVRNLEDERKIEQAATFEYPFSFQLPPHIPSTYRGLYGGVHYSLECIIETVSKVQYVTFREITVFSPINLGAIRGCEQQGPFAYSVERDDLWGGCCSANVVSMDVYLNKRMFVPGDVAIVKLEVHNESSEKILSIKAEMEMMICSRTTRPRVLYRRDSKVLARYVTCGLTANGCKTYMFELKIPETVVVPNFKGCMLFGVKSTIKVTAAVRGTSGIQLVTNIILGHIPVGILQVLREKDKAQKKTVNYETSHHYVPTDASASDTQWSFDPWLTNIPDQLYHWVSELACEPTALALDGDSGVGSDNVYCDFNAGGVDYSGGCDFGGVSDFGGDFGGVCDTGGGFDSGGGGDFGGGCDSGGGGGGDSGGGGDCGGGGDSGGGGND